MKKFSFIFIIILIIVQCKPNPTSKNSDLISKEDPLPSFNEGAAKENIMAFVNSVTDNKSKQFVPIEDRIVCFDNDGTLWAEQPLPNQVYFAVDRIRQMAAKDQPEWANENPFRAIINNDEAQIKQFHAQDIIELVGKSEVLSQGKGYDSIIMQWAEQKQHPVLQKPYTQLIYQPMLELLNYLRSHDFTIYIVSGGGETFMRALAPKLYGIPKENIIGSTFRKEVVSDGNSKEIVTTDQLEFNDDKEGKVLSIDKYIGKKPIMIVGNSDGDLAMMEYTATDNPLPHFILYLKHTDAVREFDYNQEKPLAGTLIKGEEVAKAKNWTLINMKSDWNQVFVE